MSQAEPALPVQGGRHVPGRIFSSFLMAGYECAAHRRADGRRLDLLASTGHAAWATQDYQQLAALGIRCVRDGLRWHLIERQSGRYDWRSLRPQLRAAQACGVQVIWDLCHYGYPDGLDIWRPAFVERFARYAGAAARWLREEGIAAPFYTPVNEISYWSWAGGEVGGIRPAAQGRGDELKHQLVRASIAAIEAIREVDPGARFMQCEPLVNVVSASRRAERVAAAEAYRQAQFQALDMLTGRRWPGLGGREDYLDVLGVNYYPANQWYFQGPRISPDSADFRPLVGMLSEVYQRYQRPLLLSETGTEGEQRVPWLNYIVDQLQLALARGVPVEGLCWYPFLDYPGWDNDRYCAAGLFGYPDAQGRRPVHRPLQVAMQAAAARFAPATGRDHDEH
ncbi:beta-glucosidase [uncultured Pseudomonas sp.]|uniref:beta-glucosidase n=1 Tax=uncultured Pseudomonas sp. TaxID=114707 RepID=UPI0025DB17C4|nr:beta-glucosidase [uncultured Pseudomonas sp.]